MKPFLTLRSRIFDLISKRCYPTLREKANPPSTEELYEPIFENERQYPDLSVINVRLQAYDFQPVEKFQSYIHWAAKKFGIRVIDSFAVAHSAELIKEFKQGSSLPITQFELKTYDRVLRLGPVAGVQLPLLIMLLQAHAPVGVQITVKEHEKWDEKYRYMPDPQLEGFKETLRNLDDPGVRKQLGWEA